METPAGRVGSAVSKAQDKALAWVSLIVVAAVMIGAVAYYNFGMDRTAQPSREWTSTVQPLPAAAPQK